MSFCKQMHWEVVALVLICCYLITPGIAQCNPECCGSKNVTFPFWISNSSCGLPGFQIKCLQKNNVDWSLFLGTFVNSAETDLEILDLSYDGSLIINSTDLKAMSCNETDDAVVYFKLPADGPFTIYSSNKFVVVGCRSKGSFEVSGGVQRGRGECESACLNQDDPRYCNLYGCCEAGIPGNAKEIFFTGGGISYAAFTECGFSTILEPETWDLPHGELGHLGSGRYGIRLQWVINGGDCATARGTSNYSCAAAAQCLNATEGAHSCKCLTGYQGSGYSKGTSCTDIDECSHEWSNTCVEAKRGGMCHNLAGSYKCSCAKGYEGDGYSNSTNCDEIDECRLTNSPCVGEDEGGVCHNSPGSYTCLCAKGYKGDGYKTGSGCKSQRSNKTAMFAVIGSGSAFVGVCLTAIGILWWLRMRYLKHARDEYFRSNGGSLLERILAEKGKQNEGKNFRIFSESELKSASRDYSDEMKLGSGGSSTVYKGILSNGTTVAIKKFKEFPFGAESEEAMNQFINEIVILSGLHHKNVVSLVGCCLQTQSPILIYEFVDGGTISHQLRSGNLSWHSRLQIAMGSADALAYLHSELDRPIIHRDVKSSNILLDNTVTPKVADFGISRLLCGNDTHLTTNVVGTHGYMDPEYFDTGMLTDRSDVYSFGVFLAELLTGREPLSPGRPPQEIVLSKFFLFKCKDNCLTEILDPRVQNEENLNEMTAVANIARECLSAEGSERPSMREVKMKVEEIGASTTLTTSIPCLNVLDHQISSADQSGSMNSLFHLTEMSRVHGR